MKKIYVNESKTAQIVLEQFGEAWYVKNQPTETGLPCFLGESYDSLFSMGLGNVIVRSFECNGEVFNVIN